MKIKTFLFIFLFFNTLLKAESTVFINGVEVLDKTIIIKIKPQFKNVCSLNEIAIPKIKQLFNQLQVISITQKFPMALTTESMRTIRLPAGKPIKSYRIVGSSTWMTRAYFNKTCHITLSVKADQPDIEAYIALVRQNFDLNAQNLLASKMELLASIGDEIGMACVIKRNDTTRNSSIIERIKDLFFFAFDREYDSSNYDCDASGEPRFDSIVCEEGSTSRQCRNLRLYNANYAWFDRNLNTSALLLNNLRGTLASSLVLSLENLQVDLTLDYPVFH